MNVLESSSNRKVLVWRGLRLVSKVGSWFSCGWLLVGQKVFCGWCVPTYTYDV